MWEGSCIGKRTEVKREERAENENSLMKYGRGGAVRGGSCGGLVWRDAETIILLHVATPVAKLSLKYRFVCVLIRQKQMTVNGSNSVLLFPLCIS